ncbi:MAG TPA: glycosyltransferase family 4 protein, partial [Anaerolineales bacterium]|nr:glycosyltransferase family 4 protein [Anaerolineales bacterium]
PETQEICTKVDIVLWKEFDPSTIRARLATFSLTPRSIVDTFSPSMAHAIEMAVNRQHFDLVIASELQMAAYYKYFDRIPAVLEELEIGYFYDQAFLPNGKIRFRRALTWFKLRNYLARLLFAFQACTVVSEKERQLLIQNFSAFKKQIEVIPNCLNINEYNIIKPDKKDTTLIFSGAFKYHANYEAMLWFIGEVFPLILEQVPGTQLVITGDHDDLPLPSSKNITLAGFVDDIKSLVASCSISVVPLLSGGGTRLKILEAMALGTPVVATPKGAEGLDVNNNEHILIANSSAEFADCVIRLLNDEGMRLQIAEKADMLVREKYDWSDALSTYSKLIQSLV